MIGEVNRYLEEKDLEVSVGKTKIMRFGRGKEGKGLWKWGEREIEKVEYKYLGYMFRRNGRQERQIRNRVRKAGGALRSVWEIGKRLFRRNYEEAVVF